MCSLNSQVYLDNEESNNYEADLVACPNSIYKVAPPLKKEDLYFLSSATT